MMKFNILTLLTVAIFGVAYVKKLRMDERRLVVGNQSKPDAFYLYCLFAVAFFVRIIAAISYFGHETDMNCFFS